MPRAWEEAEKGKQIRGSRGEGVGNGRREEEEIGVGGSAFPFLCRSSSRVPLATTPDVRIGLVVLKSYSEPILAHPLNH